MLPSFSSFILSEIKRYKKTLFFIGLYLLYKTISFILRKIYYTPLDSVFMYVMIFKSFAIIIFLLIAVAYFTLIERKVMASGQRRRGPNVVGYLGLLQPLADGLKLFVKEPIVPSTANLVLFFLAPLISFSLSLIGWLVIPFGETLILSNIELGLIFLLAVSALNVYGILLAGWSGNSKYAFLGSVRSITQMLSYDVALGLIFATVAVKAGSYNLIRVVEAQSQLWYLVPLFPAFMLYSVSALAETNRHPFDLPEAEAELVSGYNVEYSGMAFALFFLGEYANMLLMSAIGAALFLGGWLPILPIPYIPGPVWFGIKILFFVLLFCIARAALPRYRYDQLMFLGWKVFFPITLGWFFLVFTLSILEFNFC